MTNKTREAIKGMMAELGASRYKKSKPWNGYEVYEPMYDGRIVYTTGISNFVFVKGGEVRFPSTKEAIEYIKFIAPDEEE